MVLSKVETPGRVLGNQVMGVNHNVETGGERCYNGGVTRGKPTIPTNPELQRLYDHYAARDVNFRQLDMTAA